MNTTLCPTFATFIMATFSLSAATLYVSLKSTNPTPPYTTWATAATSIQDAVDAAKAGDTVLVTNGLYAVGERDMSALDTNQQPPRLVSLGLSRVVVTNAIRLESVNGPLVTAIRGSELNDEYGYATNGIRCVYLGGNSVLSGFTLTNGVAPTGGGVFCESPSALVTNCILTRNWMYGPGCGCCGPVGYGSGALGGTLHSCVIDGNWASFGGGAYGSTLHHCTLTGNSAFTGGGAVCSTLHNCALTSNSAVGTGGGAVSCVLYNCVLRDNLAEEEGGGALDSTLYNCSLIGNSATRGGGVGRTPKGASCFLNNCIVYYNSGGNYSDQTRLNHCCTYPLPTNGVGNVTGPPVFVDMAAGDLQLREDSPCIDAGTNLSGVKFLMSVRPEGLWMGKEILLEGHFTNPTDILGNTRFIDGDADGMVAWDIGAYEFNSFRPPQFSCPPQLTPQGWKLTITAEPNSWLRVQRSTNLRDWEDFLWPGAIVVGAEGIKQVTDGGTGPEAMFYRVLVP